MTAPRRTAHPFRCGDYAANRLVTECPARSRTLLLRMGRGSAEST